MAMRFKRRYHRYFLAPLVLVLVAGALKVRYPDMPVWDSGVYVATRVTFIARSRLGLLEPYESAEDLATELANVRKIVLSLSPGISTADPLQQALMLRDLIYRRVPVQRTAVGFNFNDLDNATRLSLVDDDYGQICGGLVITYLTVLRAFDIPARYVGIYNRAIDAPDPVISHASVDVFIERWLAMDPTFQFSVRDATGRRLGWQEARDAVKANKEIRFHDDGYRTIPGRSLVEYTTGNLRNFTDTMNYVTFSAARIGNKITPPQIFPSGWDGVIGYANGRVADVGASAAGGIYKKLTAD